MSTVVFRRGPRRPAPQLPARGAAARVPAGAARADAAQRGPAADDAADGLRRRRDGAALLPARAAARDLRRRRPVRRLDARHGGRLDGQQRRQQEGRDRRRAPRLPALPGPDAAAGPAGRRAAAGGADLAAPASPTRCGRSPAPGPAVGAARTDDDFGEVRVAVGPQQLAMQLVPPRDQAGRGPGADDARWRCAGSCAPTRRCPTCRSRCRCAASAGSCCAATGGDRVGLARAMLVPAGHLPRPGRPADRGGRRARPVPAVGLGEVAAARPAPRQDDGAGAAAAGLRRPGRAGGAARRRAGRPAPGSAPTPSR